MLYGLSFLARKNSLHPRAGLVGELNSHDLSFLLHVGLFVVNYLRSLGLLALQLFTLGACSYSDRLCRTSTWNAGSLPLAAARKDRQIAECEWIHPLI